MAHTTDQLLEMALEIHPKPPRREMDMLVSVGERMSMALLAMALILKGKEAVSFTGSQSGIITNKEHANAKIVDVRPHRILDALEKGAIPIVAGFQGVSEQGEITTLGRGGSDITAVALAAALRAPEVIFFKDVLGIYDHDPKINPDASLFSKLSYKEALDKALQGAKVLHPRSIQLAQKNQIRLSVRSFLSPEAPGTVVGDESMGSNITFEQEDLRDVCPTVRI
jgi:aspartate kinase